MGNMRIVARALKHCETNGTESCIGCPYKDKSENGRSCRQLLCAHAAELLLGAQNVADERDDLAEERAQLYEECNELRACIEEMNKPTLVGFGEKKAPAPVGEGLEAAYWHGQADALKWFMRGYCGWGLAQEVDDDA